ncbi:adenylyl-sulfate kinase [Aureimonas flava]|nr:adenylyl-sulfate kinase [Aureimonas flava]
MSRPEPDAPETLRLLACGRASARGSALLSRLVAASDAADGARRFVPIDLRGGEDHREMVRAAARCDVALVFAGSRAEIDRPLVQDLALARLMGLRHLVLMIEADAAGEAGHVDGLAADVARAVSPLDVQSFLAVPLPAERGEGGASVPALLLEHLRGLPAAFTRATDQPFRMTVDAPSDGPLLRGTVVSGLVRPGDAVVAAGSGRGARVAALAVAGVERMEAVAGETIALHLDGDVGAAPGDILAAAGDRPETCDQFAARLLWLDDEPLLPGRAYRLRVGAREVPASVTRIKHRIDTASAAPLAADTLGAGDGGRVNLSLAAPVAFEPFDRNRALGTFVLCDPSSGRTVAAGRIDFALRRAANIHRQAVDVTKAARAAAKAQRPALLWFTGLSGAGKSTIANLVEKRLFALGHHTYLLDGDNVRHGLNRDLGFTAQDRVENIRRVAETAKLMVDAGLITLASFISPFRAERRLARDLLAEGEFVEVFVDAPLGIAEARDPKGLYAQARAGRIPNFTGIDSPYEPPEAPELHLETDRRSAEELAGDVVDYLGRAGFLDPSDA